MAKSVQQRRRWGRTAQAAGCAPRSRLCKIYLFGFLGTETRSSRAGDSRTRYGRVKGGRARLMVGAEGFEPPALCSQSRCATRLRYAPTASPSYLTPRGTWKAHSPRPHRLPRTRCSRDSPSHSSKTNGSIIRHIRPTPSRAMYSQSLQVFRRPCSRLFSSSA